MNKQLKIRINELKSNIRKSEADLQSLFQQAKAIQQRSTTLNKTLISLRGGLFELEKLATSQKEDLKDEKPSGSAVTRKTKSKATSKTE